MNLEGLFKQNKQKNNLVNLIKRLYILTNYLKNIINIDYFFLISSIFLNMISMIGLNRIYYYQAQNTFKQKYSKFTTTMIQNLKYFIIDYQDFQLQHLTQQSTIHQCHRNNHNHISMKNNKWKHQRWHLLTQNKPGEASQKQSISSKDSQIFTKFTPRKSTIVSPQTKLNLAVLQKPATTPLQHSSRVMKLQGKQQSNDTQNKSVVIEPISLKLLAKRTNSQQADNSKILSKRSQIIPTTNQPLNQINFGQVKYQQPNNQYYFENKIKKGQASLKSQVIQSQQNDQTIIKNQWETINRITSQKNVEILFQRCWEFMESIQKQMLQERISVQKKLDDKYRDFVSVKQKIMKAFVLRQRQIKKYQLRKIIEQYLPKQPPQKNTLTRITSQKLFNRGGQYSSIKREIFPRQFNFDLNNNPNNFETQRQKQSVNNMSAHRRSVNSRDNSAYKSNFQTIFGTINKLKEQLSNNGDRGQIGSGDRSQRNTMPNNRQRQKLSIYYEPQKQKQFQTTTPRNAPNNNNDKDKDSTLKNLPELTLQSLKSQKKLKTSMINGNKTPLKKSGFMQQLLNASSSKISNS